jgi:hypothetical protein
VTVPLGLFGEGVAVALAVFLAVLTYFVIETPFRRSKANRPFLALSSLGLITLLVFASGSVSTSGYGARAGNIPWPAKPDLDLQYGQVITAENSRGQVLLFGDSHMRRLVTSLAAQATEFGLDFADGTVAGCPFLHGITRLGHDCTADFQAERLRWAVGVEPSFVVLGGRFPLLLEGSRLNNLEGGVEPGFPPDYVLPGVTDPDRENQKSLVQDSMRRTVESLLEEGHTVILVYPIPEVGCHVPREISRRAKQASASVTSHSPIPQKIRERLFIGNSSWPLDSPVTTSYDVYVERTQTTFEVLDSIKSDRIIRIYPHKIFCDERDGGRCVTHNDGDILYTDDDHLSPAGALLVTSEIMGEISRWGPKP